MFPFLTRKKLRPVQSIDLQIKSQKFIKYQKIFPHKYKKMDQNMPEKCIQVGGFYLFCPGDLVTRTEQLEIRAVSGRLPGRIWRVGIDACSVQPGEEKKTNNCHCLSRQYYFGFQGS